MRRIDAALERTRHHYRWLSAATADVDPDAARFEIAPGRPSIAWIVGHLTAVADSVAEAVAGIGRHLPSSFEARAASRHWGVAGEADWSELRGFWFAVSTRTLVGLTALDDVALERPPAVAIEPVFADRLKTRAAFLDGHLFHVAYHLGQIGTLRAAGGLGWGSAAR